MTREKVAMDLIRPRKSHLSLDMVPLIDVVFQLLIFFMLTSTFAHPSMNLILPQAEMRDVTQQETIVIHIDREGKMFLNNQPTAFDSLKSDLQHALARHAHSPVHVQGDRDMPYKFFVRVMDLARQAGATRLRIVHQGEKER